MAIDFLNSKAEKDYHWGVKTAFIIEKDFPFWGILFCYTFFDSNSIEESYIFHFGHLPPIIIYNSV